MAELAPGLNVSAFVPRGKCYVMNSPAIGVPGPERVFAVNPADWERVPPADRERLLDELVRGDAQRGLRELAVVLAPTSADGREHR